MLLTHEQFTKLPMDYIFGMNTDDYCARKYVNHQFRIYKEVITDRNVKGDIYSGFKEPKVSFYLGNDGRIYDTAQELYDGEFLTPWFDFATQKPVRDGHYETDCGMAMWSGQWFQMPQCQFISKWRGMVDVPVITL